MTLKMKKKIGIIVDGPGDLASLKARYHNKFKVLKTDGPRGHCVTIKNILSKSRKQIAMLAAFRCSKVIILTDFECRKCKYNEFLNDLDKELDKIDFGIKVEVAVPNQMIENWCLADIEACSRSKTFIKNKLKQKKYEGSHGKKEIKKLMEAKYSYSETKHGPQLFSIIRDSVAIKNSNSYKIFLDKIK